MYHESVSRQAYWLIYFLWRGRRCFEDWLIKVFQMADGRKNNGGKRPDSGRKSKAEELGLIATLEKCFTAEAREQCIAQLAVDCQSKDFHERHESCKLLLAYTFGKPTEKHQHENPDGTPLMQPVADAMIKIYGPGR